MMFVAITADGYGEMDIAIPDVPERKTVMLGIRRKQTPLHFRDVVIHIPDREAHVVEKRRTEAKKFFDRIANSPHRAAFALRFGDRRIDNQSLRKRFGQGGFKALRIIRMPGP